MDDRLSRVFEILLAAYKRELLAEAHLDILRSTENQKQKGASNDHPQLPASA